MPLLPRKRGLLARYDQNQASKLPHGMGGLSAASGILILIPGLRPYRLSRFTGTAIHILQGFGRTKTIPRNLLRKTNTAVREPSLLGCVRGSVIATTPAAIFKGLGFGVGRGQRRLAQRSVHPSSFFLPPCDVPPGICPYPRSTCRPAPPGPPPVPALPLPAGPSRPLSPLPGALRGDAPR